MGLTSYCAYFHSNMFSSSSSKLTFATQYISIRSRAANHTCKALNWGQSPFLTKAWGHRILSSRNVDLVQVPFVSTGLGPRGPGDDDRRALEAVLRLHSAIKGRNLRELSDLIGDECQCVCNFFSSFHPLQGKKQVLELFVFLMRYMGENIEFVVQPTMHDGMQVAVSWKLEWKNNTNVPLGKGFSFYTCHTYQGKVRISNVEMFMEPLLQIEPFFRLKLLAVVMPMLDIIKGHRKRILYMFLSLVALIASLYWLKLTLFSV